VENEKNEYESLDELLATYVQCTNDFIDKLVHHLKFKPTEEQLNELLETRLRNIPEYTAYGFCMDNDNPGGFICGYKSRPGTPMSKIVSTKNFLFFFE
jgi:hypothetical protein